MLKTVVLFLIFLSYHSNISAQQKPNVIFILADDVGYDLLSVNGNKSYTTPNIDSMAHHGINFTHCEGTPLCSPSRCMLLTGKYNFRNYSNWGYMNETEKTFGNVMQDAGYKTGFFGKLNLPFSNSLMKNWGFDTYTLFGSTGDTVKTLRYKNPTLIDNNGRVANKLTKNKYCDDILTDRLLNFIDRNASTPFFVYYSMSLTHEPFSPTPHDSDFIKWNPLPNKSDTSFFHSMVEYMDFKVGVILDKLKKKGLERNTIVIFSGDNGSPAQIYYKADTLTHIQGQKSHTTERGTHVPLIAYWPTQIKEGLVNDDLIDFSDFLPTFAQAADIKSLTKYGNVDGLSFYKRMLGIEDTSKQQLFCHYDPYPGFDALKRWVRNKKYKLYDSSKGRPGRFYNMEKDISETNFLQDNALTAEEKTVKLRFQSILDSMPTWPDAPLLKNPFVKNITSNSAEIGATLFNAGASELIDRGSTIKKSGSTWPYIPSNIVHDSLITLGTFSEKVDNLLGETLYSYSLYAMNKDTSHNTGYAVDSFYTLSRAPLMQISNFKASVSECSVLLNWGGVVFPNKYATKGGYAVFYSSDSSIKLVDNPNGVSPSKIAKNGKLVSLITAQLPNLPDTFVRITNLPKNVRYYFLVLPFTYNGITDLTCNYLTNKAPAITAESDPNPLNLNSVTKNPACFNNENGSIIASALNGKAPYSFSLNNKDYSIDSAFHNLKSGQYLLKVKDGNFCVDSQSIVLTNPKAFQVSASVISPVCYGDTTTVISASASGGITPYQFSLNNNLYTIDSVFAHLLPGDYLLYAKDVNACKDSVSITVKQSQPVKLMLSVQNADCIPASDGFITASAKNGVPPYLFSLNNGKFDTQSTFINLAKGNYKISVEDSNKCIASLDAVVSSATQNCRTGIIILPNPSSSEFKIIIPDEELSKHVKIKVYDALGNIVYSNHGTQVASYAFGAGLDKGIYFVKVELEKNMYTYKVIKE